MNLSRNRLSSIPALSSRRLSSLDLSSNQIKSMVGLSQFSDCLRVLNLAHNQITEIQEVESMRYLERLVLERNQLTSLNGIEAAALPLESIDLSHNRIDSLNEKSFCNMRLLRELLLSVNAITDITGFPALPFLKYIDLSINKIEHVVSVQHLNNVPTLTDLNLRSNPLNSTSLAVISWPSYKAPESSERLAFLSILSLIPNLITLNEIEVCHEDKLLAEHTFIPSLDYLQFMRNAEKRIKTASKPARYIPLEDRYYSQFTPLVLVGLSGVGKRTLSQKLVEKYPIFKFCCPHTTRKPRAGEREGVDYYFVTHNYMKSLIAGGEALQLVTINGEIYGIMFKTIWACIVEGRIPILDVEIEAAIELKQLDGLPINCILVTSAEVNQIEARLKFREEKTRKKQVDMAAEQHQQLQEQKRQHDAEVVQRYRDRKEKGLLTALPLLEKKAVVIPSLENAIDLELHVSPKSEQDQDRERGLPKTSELLAIQILKKKVGTSVSATPAEPASTIKDKMELYERYRQTEGFFERTIVNVNFDEALLHLDEFVSRKYDFN